MKLIVLGGVPGDSYFWEASGDKISHNVAAQSRARTTKPYFAFFFLLERAAVRSAEVIRRLSFLGGGIALAAAGDGIGSPGDGSLDPCTRARCCCKLTGVEESPAVVVLHIPRKKRMNK